MTTQPQLSIWQCLEILKEKRGWFFPSRVLVEKKIQALTWISEHGSCSDICNLVPFLKDRSKDVGLAVANTIGQLFAKLKSKDNYYDMLRYCEIYVEDIGRYKSALPRETFVQLMIVSSMNHNGYVRERAVEELSQSNDPRAIQFLMYRLADWVKPVREAALKGISIFKKPLFLDDLVANMNVLEWLQKVRRVNMRFVYEELLDFIVNTNKEFVSRHFYTFPDPIRLILARYMSQGIANKPEYVPLLLADKHFLIRDVLTEHLNILSESNIRQLLNDKSGRVRLHTLYQIQNTSDFQEIIYSFIADSASSVRQLARYSLKGEIADFACIYHQYLVGSINVLGSMAGLAEVDGKPYAYIVESYLRHEKIKFRKAAFLALQKLDEMKAYQFALENMDSPLTGIRKMSIDFLSLYPNKEVLDKARCLFASGNGSLKRYMLRFFNKLGGWLGIGDTILGTLDPNEEIRQISLEYLNQWKMKAFRLFSRPDKEEWKRIKTIFRKAYELHSTNLYFRENPLEGMEIYFKD